VSSEANKALARREFEELWVKGNVAVAEELYAPDAVDHNPGPGQAPGREGIQQAAALVHRAFPGQGTVLGLIAEGDTVARWWTMRGRHEGDFPGLPASHQPYTLSGIDVLRLADGKVVKLWHQEDLLGLLRQLGTIPAPGQPAGSGAGR
jgi:steroid delta-isomerase-like uncharacterized protein